jgi:hypothetical protein
MNPKLIFIAIPVILIIVFFANMKKDSPAVESYPTPVSTPIVSQSGNIKVTSPTSNQKITSPVTITGEARVFENSFSYRVVDANKKILIEGHAMADAPDMGKFGPFEVKLDFPTPSTDTGEIVVFAYSAKDGSEIDKVGVPIIFSQ